MVALGGVEADVAGAELPGDPDGVVLLGPALIGLALVLFHLVSIPVSNASLNPARSTATALFGGGTALASLWLYWVAPIVGGVIGGIVAKWLQEK